MMQADLDKCVGCRDCLETCPVDAISMVGGRAFVDTDTCLVCGACVQACIHGAISQVRAPAPLMALDFQPDSAHPMISTSHSESRLAWAAPVLSYVGREIVPRVVDSLIAALDRRLSFPTGVPPVSSMFTAAPNMGRRRQVRRRRRCRSFK